MSDNPRWEAVKDTVQAQHELRNKVYEKCADKCMDCGLERLKTDTLFEVHHKKPRCYGGDDSLDNLELLCRPCHKKTFGKVNGWTRKYTNIESPS